MNGEDLPGLDEIADPYLYDWIQGDRPNVPEDHYFSISLRELDDLAIGVRNDTYEEANNLAQSTIEIRVAAYKKSIDEEYVQKQIDEEYVRVTASPSYRDGQRDMAVKVTKALEPVMKLLAKWDKEHVDRCLSELFDKEL